MPNFAMGRDLPIFGCNNDEDDVLFWSRPLFNLPYANKKCKQQLPPHFYKVFTNSPSFNYNTNAKSKKQRKVKFCHVDIVDLTSSCYIGFDWI